MKGCVTKMMFKNRERIWVAGAGGQVGRDFVRLLEKAEEVELIPTDIGDVDITDGDSVRLFPEIIVNCVGMTDILACEENKDDAFRINALGARNLSVAARSFRSRIVQISTDDVFDGTTEQPYDEFDTPVPNSVYGKSKLAGENFVRSIAPKYLILRSSWVYGEGKNFVTDVLRKIENGETIQVEQGYASPTSALEAARMILRLLEEEPDLQLRMLTANTRELLERLDRGELDFAIVEGYFDRQAYDSLTYCVQPFLPVCAPEYSFARPVRRLEDLLGERLLVREPGSGTRNVLERALEARNLQVQSFRRYTELGSLNLIKALVCAGAGISFFYRPVVREELDRGLLREIPLEDCAVSHEFTFLWHRGSVFSPQYRELFQRLRRSVSFLGETVDIAGENLHNRDENFVETDRKKESL